MARAARPRGASPARRPRADRRGGAAPPPAAGGPLAAYDVPPAGRSRRARAARRRAPRRRPGRPADLRPRRRRPRPRHRPRPHATPRSGAPWPSSSSVAAAGVHAAVFPHHLDEAFLVGAFFLAITLAQAAWACLVCLDATRRLLLAGIAGNLALVALWAVSRSVGLPVLGREARRRLGPRGRSVGAGPGRCLPGRSAPTAPHNEHWSWVTSGAWPGPGSRSPESPWSC